MKLNVLYWPWGLHAQLVEQLQADGAKAIAFDFLFEAETEEDVQLATAMQSAGNVVQPVLGLGDAFHSEGVMRYEGVVWPNVRLETAGAGVGHTNILHDDDGLVRQIPTVIEVDDVRYPSLALAALQAFLGTEVGAPALPQAGALRVLGSRLTSMSQKR